MYAAVIYFCLVLVKDYKRIVIAICTIDFFYLNKIIFL